jgi:hypothetical protein
MGKILSSELSSGKYVDGTSYFFKDKQHNYFCLTQASVVEKQK